MSDPMEYRGWRTGDEAHAAKFSNQGRMKLEARLDLANHSPDGFEWGYGGSGPAQLALAILADGLGDDARALKLYQNFARAVIQPLPREAGWSMTRENVIEIARTIEEALGG